MRIARHEKKYRLLSLLFAAIVTAGLIIPALAQIQWPTKIERFERYNPVYTETVALGTAREELKLPQYLRAVVPLSDAVASSFVQAEPIVDMTDGYEHYDYYNFGYVAPKDVAGIYASGGKAIYTIHYADRNGEGVLAEIAYRVYGSIGGSENTWFACNEAGSVTGVVLDIPVTWKGDYDENNIGEYTLAASFSGYTYSEARPFVKITVEEAGEVCTCGAAEGEAHGHDCPLHEHGDDCDTKECTCGAQADENGVTTHAEDCALYTEETQCTCGAQADENGVTTHAGDCALYTEEIHCTCEVGEDTYSEEHSEDCPYFEKVELLCTCDLATNETSDEHDISCPCYVRLAVDCHCGIDGQAIDEDNFAWAHLEDCIHFSPIECMCREMVETTYTDYIDGVEKTHTEMVPGDYSHVHDPENIDCPLYAKDTVRFKKLVSGEESVMSQEDANKIIAVQEAAQALAARNLDADPSEAQSGGEAQSNLEAQNGLEPQSSPEVQSSPDALSSLEALSSPDALSSLEAPGGEEASAGGEAPGGEEAQTGEEEQSQEEQSGQEAGVLYPALGKIELVKDSEQSGNSYDTQMKLLSINGGGANDRKIDSYIVSNTPTSGNADAWTDYLNTMWRNKAHNVFAWTLAEDTGAHNSWAWDGKTATGTTGFVTTNPNRTPSKSGNVYTVYSGQQMRFAMTNLKLTDPQVTIKFGANINLNGDEYSWTAVLPAKNLDFNINGNGKTIYNFSSDASHTDLNKAAAAMINGMADDSYSSTNPKSIFENMTFKTAKLASYGTNTNKGSSIFGSIRTVFEMTDITISDSMFYGLDVVSPFFTSGTQPPHTADISKVTRAHTENNYMYGRDHIGGSFCFGSGNTYRNCSSVNSLLVSVGFHSGGFMSCFNQSAEFYDCYAVNEMYSKKSTGMFCGYPGEDVIIENCFTSGKLEGMEMSGGFLGEIPAKRIYPNSTLPRYQHRIKNCYSTTLVGMRSTDSSSQYLGSFAGAVNRPTPTDKGNNTYRAEISNCYAAGEVGNYDVDMDLSLAANPQRVGGFLGEERIDFSRFTNCYYDKQTTAAREWGAGNDQNYPGITGVLTTDTVNSGGETVNGLTGIPSGSTLGFRGFTDTTKWQYQDGHYPQLTAFSNASSADWGSSERANLAKAYSLASTSTVMLNTWQKGYDWNDEGVRTKLETSYDRDKEDDHKGHRYTYDTVREITSPFTVTNGNASYSHMVGTGAPSMAGPDRVTDTVVIDDATKTGRTENPGMDWYRISTSVGGQTGHRPIRLIGYMGIDAGQNKTVSSGQRYDHRPDVTLTMVDTLTDNLVVGVDDAQIWSTSIQGGYPEDSRKYWAVPTMETSFAASKNAWIYTEIWRAAQNPDGTYAVDTLDEYGFTEVTDDGTYKLVPDLSVKVTGSGTGSGLTLDEQKWNGELPIYPDTSIERKYIISYYWMLADGRYATDYKIITIEPGEYDLTLDVLSMEAGTKSDPTNSHYLYLGTEEDDAAGELGYILSDATETKSTAVDIPYTKNSAAAWKKLTKDVLVRKGQIDLYANDADKTLMGTGTFNNVVDGSPITIPTDFYYITKEYDNFQGAFREITERQTVDVTYTVVEKKEAGRGTGEFYLRFNKLANVPDDEIAFASEGTNDTGGIPDDALAYINDTQFNTEITLWVSSGTGFEFIKTDEDGNPFGEGDAEFQLYSCGHVHDADCGGQVDEDECNHYHELDSGGNIIGGNHSPTATNEDGCCWLVEGHTVRTEQTDDTGRVVFSALGSGDYILAETKTKEGYQLPVGQWLLHVDAISGTVTITARGDIPPAFKVERTSTEVLMLPNYRQMTLPASGGAGTIAFTIGGIVLIGIAVILIVVLSKKKPKDKD